MDPLGGVMRTALVQALVLALAMPSPLLADKSGKGRKHKDKRADAGSVTFTVDQRGRVQGFFVERHGRGKCPPGLAKKNRLCLPPGQMKKRYVVGQPVPHGIEILAVPRDLVVRLGPPARGYTYGMIDGDLVTLAVGTLLVVDAIDGLVE
jgi:hypothetical protein